MFAFDDYEGTDPDDPEFIEQLREQGLDDEQIEQAQQQLRFLLDMSPEQREAHRQQSNDVSMGRSLTPRYTDTAGIMTIEHVAAEMDLNRRISDEGLKALDPEGTHVLHPFMIHRYAQGQPVGAHMRCHVWLKVKGQTLDIEADPKGDSVPKVWMDVPMHLFIQLPEATDTQSHGDWQDNLWRVILGGS